MPAIGYVTKQANGGFKGQLYVMQSNCGVDSLEATRRIPITMVESGPASGFWGAAELGRLIGEPNVLALDIGWGTVLAIKTLIVLAFIPLSALILGYVFLLKMMSHMQSRMGPMDPGGFHGWYQLIGDGLRGELGNQFGTGERCTDRVRFDPGNEVTAAIADGPSNSSKARSTSVEPTLCQRRS